MRHRIGQTVRISLLTLCSAILGSGQVSVLTQHNDNARTGQNLSETTLNTSNVNVSGFGKLFWRTVDGFMYAQPLYVYGLTIQGATHNVVYVATEHNSVYAFDADNPNTPDPLWQVNLGTPVPSQDICIITGDTNPGDCPYYDISPEIGITSTPVIDPVAGIIYVVDRTKNTSNSTYHDYLHALSLTTGAEQLGGPVEITGQVSGTGDGSSGGVLKFDPTYHNQRPSLLLSNGVLYIGFGSVGDIGGIYHGWLMSYNATTLQQEAIFCVSPNGYEGGIWSAGQGPVADGSGNVYIMTANGDFTASAGGVDYGDSFMQFSGPTLAVTGYFTPDTQETLYTGNIDLGSGGPMLMPGTSLLVGMGKDGIFRVVNTNTTDGGSMGGYNASSDGDVQEFTATPNPFFSSPIYWNSSNNGPVVYIWGAGDLLKAYQFTGSKFNTTPVSQGTITNSQGISNAAPLSISAQGSLAGTGILWSTQSISQWASGVQVPGVMRAFDATNLATELWDSTQNLARDDIGNYAKYNPPTIANGKVYVGSYSGQLQVYGLNPPAFQGVQFVQVASATPQSTTASVSVAYTNAQTAGDLNVVIVGWNDSTATVNTVTDSAGNKYVLAVGPTRGTSLSQSIYYAKSILGGSANTVTVTFNEAATKPDIRILEYSGVNTSNPLDVSAGASGTSNVADSGFVSTSAGNELIIGANTVQSNTTIMAGAPFTPRIITTPNSDVAEDRLVNVPGSYHSWTPLNASGAWVEQVVTFQAAAQNTVPFPTSVSPNTGSVAGGTAVTITGTGFATGASVTFGTVAATSVVVVNSTTITATSPAGSVGSVTVTVTESGQSGSLASAFTYVSSPTVTSVSPNSGSTAGGTAVTIAGTNFGSGATVTFGTAAATNVVVVSGTQITATTPAGAAGAVTVTVTNGASQSGSLASGFTYVVVPTVSSISPNSGPVAGGTAVTLTGTNFATGATVTFGGAAATSVVVVNSTTITATTPAESSGGVTVTVTVNGQSGSLANGFTYTGTVAIAFTQVASATPQSATASVPVSYPAAQTAGDLNVVVVGWNDATSTVQSVKDSAGNNYLLAIGPTVGTGLQQSIYYASRIVGGSNTVTVTFNQAAAYPDVRILEYQGVTALDVTAGASGSSTAPSSGAATTTSANEVIFGANTVATANSAAGTGFTSRIITSPDEDLAEDKIVTATGSNSATATLTQSGAWVMQMATFAAVSGPAPTVTSVSPNGGSTAGGTAVTITGTNFVSGAAVTFGTAAATNVVVVSGTSITATTPAGTAGAVTVTVTVGGESGSLAGAFTYSAAPTVSSVTPNSGSTAGGAVVTITGTNFASGATVTFGSTAATNVVVVNATSITATTPAGSAGAVTVTVTVSGQSGSLASAFTYVVPPTVSSVSPNSGSTAGGTAVTITGTNFVSGAAVEFGTMRALATNVVVVNPTTITATTPAGTLGAATVTVTVNLQSGSLSSGFTYIATPSVSSVSPSSGPAAGGTAVTITGTNFASGATVTFGSAAATSVVFVSATEITATTPAGSAGAVTVTVTAGGQSGSLTNGFTYAVVPTVSSVSPASGSTLGGTAVTITGTNFAAGAAVTFGAAAATNVVVVSGTQITATTPAGSLGAVTLTVTNVGSQSGSLASGYTYVVAPTVTSVSPNSGPVAGGTAVTITGTNFATGATVTIGGTVATSVVVVNSTTITAKTPAGNAGAVTVTVTVSGQSGSLANGFTYTGTVAISFAQVASATPQSATATVPVTYPAAQTAGDLNVVVVGWNDTTSTVQSVKDSVGNIYLLAVGPTVGTGLQQSIYYSANIIDGTNTVTVTFNQAAAYPDVRILEYRGVTGLDVTAGASGNSTAASSGVATTTNANELIFGANTVATLNAAAGTGFTSRIITTPNGDLAEDKTVTAAGSNSATATLTDAGPWVMQMATFAAVSYPVPTVTGVAPAIGSTTGGTAVTITGTNFVAGAAVTFGATAATNAVVVNATTITATTPAGSAGAVTATVINPGGQSGSLASAFTYVAPPTVSSVSPNNGSSAGGTAVTITGTNFAAGATVKFGSTAAANVTFVSSTTITVATPAGSAGAVTVTITNSNGTSGSLASAFTYVVPPTVSSVSPNSGSTAGGTAVTITGTNFVAGATVTFGSAAATNVVVLNTTTVTATTPAGSLGAVTVTVTVSGQSGSLSSGFTYAITPTVSSVSPNSGPAAGGTAVTITGTNFASGATVTFGSTAATTVVFVSATQITATTPAGSAGAVTVTVTAGGQSGSLTNGFTYASAPTVSSVSPASGSTLGGTSVIITGTNFAAGATVTFGAAAATNVVVVSGTQITATTPAGSAGAVTVTVTNVGSQSGSLTSGYTYAVTPTVSSVSPNSGPAAGGTAVTLTGTNFATGATVTFGGTAATTVVVVNGTTITAKTPAGIAGAVTVTVTVSGQSGSLANGFTYTGTVAISFAQVASATPQSATATVPVTYPAAQTAGDLNVVVVGWNDTTSTVQSVKDSAGNNYLLAIGPTAGTGLQQSIYYAPNIVAGSNTVTVTFNQAAAYPDVRILEYRGVTALDVKAGASGSSTAANSGAATTTSANELIFGANTVATGNKTVGTGFTSRIITTPDSDLAEDETVTAVGSNSATATLTASGPWVMQMATFAAISAPVPTVTGVAPGSGSTAGGTAVTITGTNFAAGATVNFGTTAATNIVVVSGTQITATTPAGSAGAVTVTVTVNGQSGSLAAAFTYVVPPAVSSVSPSSGSTLGGTAVTITGTNFAAGATVTFGTAAAANVLVVSGTEITATTPAGSAGAVTVAVTVNGQSGSLAAAFTYIAPPTVSSVSPSSGPLSGGTAVTITGTNFAAGATVKFGGAAATSVVVVSGTEITATTPAGSAGAVTATVTNSNGLSGSLASAFTYGGPPTVSSVSPNSGSTAGGTPVTITGTNFAAGATVTFGAAAATNIVVVSGTEITATSPAGSAGAVTVTVTVSGLSGSLTSAFTYLAPPTVSSVSPNTGSTAGGTAVTVTGANFAAGATVTFGAAAATNVVVVSGTQITAATPAGSAGAVTVTVTVSGQSGTLVSGFTYVTPSSVTAPGNFAGALVGTSVPTYVAGVEYYNATPGNSFTTSAFNSTGADLLVMLLGSHNHATFTITDTYGNTWLPLAGPAYKVGSAYYPMESAVYYVPNAKTGANHTVTVGLTFSPYAPTDSEPLVVSVVALSGDNIYSPIDAYSPITGDNGTISEYIASSPLTTFQPNDLLLGMVKGFGNNTYTAGTGYTSETASTGQNFSAEIGTAASVGNYASSFTASVGDFWQVVTTAIAPKPTETVLSWTASSSSFPIANYYIERCLGLSCSNFVQIGSVSGSTLTYPDSTILAGTAYSYRVRSEDSGGSYSPYSTTQAVTPITPQVVSSFAATSTRALSWNPSAETGGSIGQYSIERCTGLGCSNFSQIATTAGTSYTDASAAAGTTYNYRVRAQDANNIYGPYSVVATASIPAYFDNAVDGGNNGGGTSSLTYSYTVGTNTNRLLLVNLVGDTSADDISSVKYAGAAMTLVNKVQASGDRWHYLYYLLSPATGTNSVVVTAASAHWLISEAASWYNIAQSAPLASTSNTATSNVVSLTTSLPASSNSAIVAGSMWAYTGVMSGNGSTSLVVDSAFQGLGMFSSVPSPVTQAFPVSMTNTWGGQNPASGLMASFLLASNGTAGITYDNSVDGGNNHGSTNSLTYPFTVGSGSNRLLIVNLVGDNFADDITSVTYAGAPLTLLKKIQAPGADNYQYLYYLLEPASGTNNIVITAASSHYLISEAASWYNVSQSAQPDALTSNTAAAGSTSITTSLTTIAPGSLVVQGIWSYGHLEAGTGATPIVIDAAIGAAALFVSTGSPVSPAGNVSMTTLSDGTQSSGVIMVSFAPAVQ